MLANLLILAAAQSVNIVEVRPDAFYISGIRQGMTFEEYSAIISNGRYTSRPVMADTYLTNIESRELIVRFCQGRVTSVLATCSSADWLESMQKLEGVGFKFGIPVVSVEKAETKTGSLMFAVTTPKDFKYFVVPTMKAFVAGGRDFPLFQLNFWATIDPCRVASSGAE